VKPNIKKKEREREKNFKLGPSTVDMQGLTMVGFVPVLAHYSSAFYRYVQPVSLDSSHHAQLPLLQNAGSYHP
jgi:hypothetical protein